MNDVALNTNDLSVGYHGRKRTALLRGLNLNLRPRRLTCLIGQNGVGKSTLIRTLAGLQKPVGGGVSIHGADLERVPPAERARLVSIVLPGADHHGNLKCEQIVQLGRLPYANWLGQLNRYDYKIAMDSLEKIGASAFAGRRFAELSDGERQKILVARALAQQTPILILDEPTAFLDWTNRLEMLILLKEIAFREEKSILLSSHDLDLVMRFADDLWVIDDNRAVFSGTKTAILESGVLKNAFSGKYLRYLEDSRTD